ncbi:hypothetical protein AAHA92_02196 [Salvia divinorum]|uniref:DUF4378 domain-containing protein n=1 Tax=Salvia divinorum TaxID=28513 RepID=A0ABD1IH37_SALDI
MNDTAASSLAIVEKKPQRPGGCVGIFFQLFDWNRRFAKKKLFSKKLLPPVRFKQASKKFGGDEKQPKLRLIADENNGGFPTAKMSNGAAIVDSEQNHEMHVPGLVARLMGLDSMPALQRDKSKTKAPPASGVVSRELVDKREELKVEKVGIKHEVRPQKLQKTSVSERQPITRFGAEKLPFKNVLSKSKKHHPKFPPQVKSPKNIPRKRPSKLIGAATRILEPGLQSSRSKCVLTYPNASRHSPQDTDMEESLSSHLEGSYGFGSVAAEGESSCKNCGYVLDNLNGKPTITPQPLEFASPFSNNVRSCCQVSAEIKPVNVAFYHQLEEEFHDGYPVAAAPVIGDVQSHCKLASYRSPFCAGHIQQHLAGQHCKAPRGVPLPLSPNQKPYRQNQMLRARETVPLRPNVITLRSSKASTTVMNGTKNPVSENQSLSCSPRSRVPSRIEDGRFEMEKRIPNRMNDSILTGRKRRPNNLSREGEYSGCSSYTVNKPIISSPNSVAEKQMGYNCHLVDHECGQVGLLRRQDRKFTSVTGNNNVVSFVPFTFNSSVKQKVGIHEVGETLVRSGDGREKSEIRECVRKTGFEKSLPISGDALGALLEQKLKELNCQGEDTGNAPKKTTATILQELITALTSEVQFQQDNLPAISDRRNGWSDQSRLSNSKSSNVSHGSIMGVNPSSDQPLDTEHLSPGSVLETCFSTESFPSSSADDGLGSPNPDLLDTVGNSKEMIVDILNNVSEILCCSGLTFGLKGNEVDQVREVLLNAELVFHRALLSGSAVGKGSPIKHLLLDELDMLASLLWMNFGSSLGVEDGKEVNQLKTFVLDSTIEYLGVRFQEFQSKGSRKLPLRMNNRMLILEIVEVVRRWEELSRLGVDELIEREMSRSLEEWTQCESEAFESGVEISKHLVQILVDEIVMDLCKW